VAGTSWTFFTTFAGCPIATEKSGMFRLTTLIAPIVQPRPIVTPGKITYMGQPLLDTSSVIWTYHVSTNPAIISNDDGSSILDVVSPRLYFRLMCSRKNGHIRSKHAPIANSDEATIQDCKVEICVESFAKWDVAAIVDVEGGFNEYVVVAHATNNALEHFQTLRSKNVEAFGRIGGCIREPGVEFVSKGSGFETGFIERRFEGVVPGVC
jgi:hypothetical protein